MTHSKPNQTARVLRYMQDFGSITQREAITDLGVYRLASRISELKRDGHPISSKTESVQNRYGETSHISRYYLESERRCKAHDPEGMR